MSTNGISHAVMTAAESSLKQHVQDPRLADITTPHEDSFSTMESNQQAAANSPKALPWYKKILPWHKDGWFRGWFKEDGWLGTIGNWFRTAPKQPKAGEAVEAPDAVEPEADTKEIKNTSTTIAVTEPTEKKSAEVSNDGAKENPEVKPKSEKTEKPSGPKSGIEKPTQKQDVGRKGLFTTSIDEAIEKEYADSTTQLTKDAMDAVGNKKGAKSKLAVAADIHNLLIDINKTLKGHSSTSCATTRANEALLKTQLDQLKTKMSSQEKQHFEAVVKFSSTTLKELARAAEQHRANYYTPEVTIEALYTENQAAQERIKAAKTRLGKELSSSIKGLVDHETFFLACEDTIKADYKKEFTTQRAKHLETEVEAYAQHMEEITKSIRESKKSTSDVKTEAELELEKSKVSQKIQNEARILKSLNIYDELKASLTKHEERIQKLEENFNKVKTEQAELFLKTNLAEIESNLSRFNDHLTAWSNTQLKTELEHAETSIHNAQNKFKGVSDPKVTASIQALEAQIAKHRLEFNEKMAKDLECLHADFDYSANAKSGMFNLHYTDLNGSTVNKTQALQATSTELYNLLEKTLVQRTERLNPDVTKVSSRPDTYWSVIPNTTDKVLNWSLRGGYEVRPEADVIEDLKSLIQIQKNHWGSQHEKTQATEAFLNTLEGDSFINAKDLEVKPDKALDEDSEDEFFDAEDGLNTAAKNVNASDAAKNKEAAEKLKAEKEAQEAADKLKDVNEESINDADSSASSTKKQETPDTSEDESDVVTTNIGAVNNRSKHWRQA